jgi:hypothetical protein
LYQDHALRNSSAGMGPCQVIYPGWAIGLESDPATLQAASNTVWLAAQWYDNNNCCNFYPDAACVGYDPNAILSNMDTLLTYYQYANFMIDPGGGGTENYSIATAGLAAMFLQSYQTNLHVFPDWPANQSAAFGNLNACGGFLVSSAITLGQENYVQIQSTAGQMLKLANPWPGATVQCVSSLNGTTNLSGTVLNYQTQVGEVLTLTSTSVTNLPAPVNVTAVTNGNTVIVTWNAVPGAGGYNVKRATASGGPYSNVASGTTGTNYTDSSVAFQTTYYYAVSALAPGFESTNSASVAVTTPLAPPILNWSFEAQTVAANSYSIVNPTSWSVSGQSGGAVVAIIHPGTSDGRFGAGHVPAGMDGVNYCQLFMNGSSGSATVYQDLGPANQYLAGTTYTLTAAFGLEKGNFPTGALVFYNSSLVAIASNVITSAMLTSNAFTSFSVNYTGTGGEGGNGDIVVGFTTTSAPAGTSFDIDNVRLTASVAASSPPAITTPPASQTNSVGATVSFSVGATGTAPLSYQWQAAGAGVYTNLVNGPQISGSASNVLTIANLTTNWALAYRAIVSNSIGSVTSAPSATLTVNSSPAITTPPASQRTVSGRNVSFSVAATGSAPLSYQWKAGAVGSGIYTNLTDGGQVSGSASSVLTISGVTTNWALAYVVVVSNSSGSLTSTPAATLSVDPAIRLINGDFGSGATQTGAAVLGSAGDIWNALTASTSALLDSANNSLSGVGLTLSDQGVFDNTGGTAMDAGTTPLMRDYAYGGSSPASVTVSLTGLAEYTNSAFTLVVYGAGDTSGQGATLQLTAGATGGNSGSTLTTTATSRQISAGLGVAYNTFTGFLTGGTLTFTATKNSGQSYVIVNGFQLRLSPYSDPAITTQPVSQTNSAGSAVSFSVGALGTAPLSYQWQAAGAGAYTNLVNGPQVSGATSNVLTIANLTTNWALAYQVIVTNANGSVTSAPPATLTVQSKPVITIQPASQTNAVGATVSFSAAALGSAPLIYQWQAAGTGAYTNLVNGPQVSGAASNVMTIANLTANWALAYRVVVTNSYGSVTSTPPATLTVSSGSSYPLYTSNQLVFVNVDHAPVGALSTLAYGYKGDKCGLGMSSSSITYSGGRGTPACRPCRLSFPRPIFPPARLSLPTPMFSEPSLHPPTSGMFPAPGWPLRIARPPGPCRISTPPRSPTRNDSSCRQPG